MSTVWQNTTGAREFSRRRVVVNGFCCRPPACPPARVVTLCRALFSGGERLRRQMTPGWRPLPCVERRRPPFFRAPLQPIGVCKSGRGVHCEKNGANRHPPACLQRKRRVAADDLAFSLLSFGCTSPPKTCRCKSGQAHRVHLANFFLPTICIICRTYYYYYYYCRGHYLALFFATVKHLFFATVKNGRFDSSCFVSS